MDKVLAILYRLLATSEQPSACKMLILPRLEHFSSAHGGCFFVIFCYCSRCQCHIIILLHKILKEESEIICNQICDLRKENTTKTRTTSSPVGKFVNKEYS